MNLLIKSLYTIKPVLPEKGRNGLHSWEEEIFFKNCVDNLGGAYAKELDKYLEISNYLKTLLFLSRKDR